MLKILKSFLNFISKNLFYLIALSITLGLLNLKFNGGYAFSSAICFAAALIMITPSLIPLDFTKLKEKSKIDRKVIFISIILNFVIYPLIAFIIAKIFFSTNPQLFLGIMLLSLLPGGGMITTWALSSESKMSLIVKIIFYNLLFAIFFLPLVVPTFMPKIQTTPDVVNSLNIDIDKIYKETGGQNIVSKVNKEKGLEKDSGCVLSALTGGYIECGQNENPLYNLLPIIFMIIVFPLLLALLLQKWFKKIMGKEVFKKNKKYFAYFANLGLVLILFVIMSFTNNLIIFEQPDLLFKSIIPVFIFYILIFSISFLVFQVFFKNTINEKAGISLFWGSTLRYITLILAFVSAVSITDSSYTIIIVIVILAYFIQIPLSFFFSKYFKKIKNN